MQRILQSDAVRQALQAKGWTQKDLAEQVGVSAQSVTNWLKGDDFPRPDKLLRLATTLRLRLDQLAAATPAEQALRPVVAFRRRAAANDRGPYSQGAGDGRAPGAAGAPPATVAGAAHVDQPAFDRLCRPAARRAARTREKLGIGPHAVLEYATLVSEFAANDAFLPAVLWGERQRHDNALHILLPVQRVTFISPQPRHLHRGLQVLDGARAGPCVHAGAARHDEGEDFADAFAGALLFPQAVAAVAYRDAAATHRKAERVAVLQRHAQEHQISLYTVFREAQAHAAAWAGPGATRLDEKADIHAVRNARRGQRVSEILFDPLPPEPATYVAAAHSTFGSEFFNALRRLLKAQGTGPGYMQQLLDISLADATALHHALTRG